MNRRGGSRWTPRSCVPRASGDEPGGDPACVFTARVRYPNPDEPSWARTRVLSDVAGGRECNASTQDSQCAYIAQGYSILAVTGQSCSQAGVPLCQGPFCI